MIDKIVKNRNLLAISIFICAIFTFGGAVNMGLTDFLFATPFMVLWLAIAIKAGLKIFINSCLIFLILILPFYILKINGSSIYFPANGREIMLIEDACFSKRTNVSNPQYDANIFARKFASKFDCLGEGQSWRANEKSKFVAKGAKFKIEKTEVSYGDFAENYSVIAHDIDGKLYVRTFFSDHELFAFADGSPLTSSDLRQPFFYYSSLLMYVALFPLLLIANL
ncbi:MAG TPA: hypothetical protein PLH13_03485 [Burkholderiaceae bacterium]|jgi:hypothetical protein|nr:hypothetical protein [Burkholderiaceae bacterium]